MNKPSKPRTEERTKINKRDESSASVTQRGFAVIELLFAASTIATTILVAAMSASKKPPIAGD
jgi:hypothetical protein